MKSVAREREPFAVCTKKARARAKKRAGREDVVVHAAAVNRERRPLLTPSAEAARDLVVAAASAVEFVFAVIPTRIVIESDGFHIQIDTLNRETGNPSTIDLRWDMPPLLSSREHALDWIYSCARDAWVHELNEALFVDGARRRELHSGTGQTIPPPDEVAKSALDSFKCQLAAFLSGSALVKPGVPQDDLAAFKVRLAAFLMRAAP